MESVLAMLLSVFVFITIIALGKWNEFAKAKKLLNLVSWSVVKAKPYELLANSHDLPLWAYLNNAQIKHIAQEYHISGDNEWQFVNEILEEYQKDLTQSYFKGQLKILKSKYEVRGVDYFMLMLYTFLSDHQCDYDFLGHDMRKERVSYKSYGSGYDATYALTDFAVVLHKMHYISYMYCRRNETLRKFAPEWEEKNLREILDTHQIQLSQ